MLPSATPANQPLGQHGVRVEMLARTVHGEVTAVASTLVGVAMLLVVTWTGPNHRMALWLMLWRLVALWHNYRTARRIAELGAELALARRLHLRLAGGQFIGAISWGLVAWFIDMDRPVSGAEPVLLLVLLTVASMVMLVSMAHFPLGLLAFVAGVWGTASIRLVTAATPHAAELGLGLLAFLCMLALYARRLHRQTRAAVEVDLHNLRLTADLAVANERLTAALKCAEDLAMHDPLTGALNRRAFVERAGAEAASMARRGTAAMLVLVDLDNFKRVNDEHGHAVGDRVLQAVSEQMRQHLRAHDAMARWGGEEFLLLLPDSSAAAALEVADRLRRAAMALPAAGWPAGLTVTLSAGIAPWASGQPLEQALDAADRALYAAKAAGRNRVHMAACGQPGPLAPGITSPS